MKSEALTKLRTMRHIKSNAEIFRGQKARTTGALFRAFDNNDATDLELEKDRNFQTMLEREKRRFASRLQSVERARARLLNSRKKLSVIINKNKALMELRRELQKENSSDMCDSSDDDVVNDENFEMHY